MCSSFMENNVRIWECLCKAGKGQSGTWNVRSMNQGKLEVVKQELARVNINILGIYICVCIYIYLIFIYIHLYVYECTSTCVYIRIHAHTYPSVHIPTHSCVYKYMGICICEHTHTPI